MPKQAILFGVLLDLLGLGAFFATGASHFTSLIPVFFGTPLIICGIIALAKPGVRKHVMHVAALFGLLGTLGGLGMGLPKVGALLAGTAERPLAIQLQVAMGILSLVFLILCVKSFIDARRAAGKA